MINGIAVAAGSAGIILAWSALHNKSVLGTLKDVIQGKQPGAGPEGPAFNAGGIVNASGAPLPGLPAVSKAAYNPAQLASLWIMAGGSRDTATNAACHAMQESSGNPQATSANPDGGTNVGLWQLDTPGGKGAGYSVIQLMDPMTNARVTVSRTGNGSDWSAWATPGC